MIEAMSAFLQAIFENKLLEDDFHQMELFHSVILGKGIFLRLPLIMFWLQVLLVAIFGMFFAAFLATIVYKQIIQQKNPQISYIVGYGVVIPMCHFYPHLCIEFLDVRNVMIRFALTAAPLLTLFRTLEAMYGFSPKGAQKSLQSFIRYFLAYGDAEFDHKSNDSIEPKGIDIIEKIFIFLKYMVFVGLYQSLLLPFNYLIFKTGMEMNSFAVSPMELLSFGHLMNMMSCSFLLQSYLVVFSIPLGIFSTLVLNVQIPYVMKNPIFTTTSPSDFWGGKWNLLIHALLKRGVYKPVRTHFSAPIALLSTFIVSGLFHEWVLTVIIRPNDEPCERCFYPNRHGSQMLFFLWNAMLVFLEFILVRRYPGFFQYFSKMLPPMVKSILIVMTALPIAHWFLTDYLFGNFFQHAQIAFPMCTVIVHFAPARKSVLCILFIHH